MKRLGSRLAFALGLSFVLSAGSGIAEDPQQPTPATPQSTAEKIAQDEEYYKLFEEFVDTMDQIERNYVTPITRRELMQAAIRGMLEKLDPHSTYIPPDDLASFQTSVTNQFGGIGVQVAPDSNALSIVTPIVGSPAYRAKIQPGDRIVEIEGTATAGMSIEDARKLLKGEPGTQVKIVVSPKVGDERREVSITREIVNLESVLGDRRKKDDHWEFMLDEEKKLGYVRITTFSAETPRELRTAMDDLVSRGLKGLVLDLRFNPGGLLTSAIEVSDMFIAEGRIVSTNSRGGDERKYDAVKPGTYDPFPMAILVNGYSASASEIVSGCLQDHNRAIIVGERTFGKGSVQNVIELEGGASALKLTTAGYLRPSGKNIHRAEGATEADVWGVSPNDGFALKLEESEMVRLVQTRSQRDLLTVNHFVPEGEQPDPKVAAAEAAAPPVANDFVDRQMQKALEYLNGELAKAATTQASK